MPYSYKLNFLAANKVGRKKQTFINPVNRFDIVSINEYEFLVVAVCHSRKYSTLYLSEEFQRIDDAIRMTNDPERFSQILDLLEPEE